MSKRVQRVPYTLDAGGVVSLSAAEIVAILRGADAMIGRGGRTQLSKLLKGSREATVLDHGLQHNPSYGFYRDLSLDEILHRIDWMIEEEYLGIVYDYRLPVLVFTDRGWSIEMATMAAELLDGFDERLAFGTAIQLLRPQGPASRDDLSSPGNGGRLGAARFHPPAAGMGGGRLREGSGEDRQRDPGAGTREKHHARNTVNGVRKQLSS